MTPTYDFFRRLLGNRLASVATALWYALLLLAVLMTLGTSAGTPILYLQQ
jgi:hypothetical protein